ncbi:hypothetical protein AYX19_21085 (plasmid) [Paenarthrobacter ureafaciens]|nr:hypothetical protein AYX19_21085 [Paenarthrobacter ureafaciens]
MGAGQLALDSTWGWDFPALAMTAARLGQPEAGLGFLVRDALKNCYDRAGHNPQMGSFLPVYLPGNGALLAALSLLLTQDEQANGVFEAGAWQIHHEGLIAAP